MSIKTQNKIFIVNVIYILICFSNAFVFSQEKIKVHASGTSITRDLTPKEALNEAILDAQKKAYNKVGIKENISVSSILLTESNGEEVNKYFNEISSIESNANIVIDSIYLEKRSFDEYGNLIISVDIDATVFKYNKEKDHSFFFTIKGLKDTYYENETISFSFTPSQNGYLKIFVLNEKETILLYPYQNSKLEYLSDKPDSLFRRNKKIDFPIHPAYKPGYSIEIETDRNYEINKLVFVYLKKDIPLHDSITNSMNLFRWIYSIPLDQRNIQFCTLVLKKR